MELSDLLQEKRRTGTAIPAFNYTDVWDLQAIVSAADKAGIAVMAASSPPVVEALGVALCHAMVSALSERCRVPIHHHLDHSRSVDICLRAIDVGYPSVMIDGSQEPLDANIALTREVVDYAHRRGAVVEAEIGKILGRGVEGDHDGGVFLAEVGEAVELVEKTGVDSLAVGIGTAHGLYRSKPELHFDRLEEIAAAVGVPLVLHGGTGIPDEDIRRAIRLGISKVNVGTMIHLTYLRGLRRELDRAGDQPYTPHIMKHVLPDIEAVLQDRIKAITAS